MTPDQARELMYEWIVNEPLRWHMECVAACMRAYAQRLAPPEADRWVVCGLLHDFDYEQHPTATPEGHPFVGVNHLRQHHPDVDREIIDAILGHASYSGVSRDSLMAKSLFAVDELAGFIVACAKVRPNGISDLEPRSVIKKLKDKSFAAKVERHEVYTGAELFGVDLAAHITFIIGVLREHRAELGLPG